MLELRGPSPALVTEVVPAAVEALAARLAAPDARDGARGALERVRGECVAAGYAPDHPDLASIDLALAALDVPASGLAPLALATVRLLVATDGDLAASLRWRRARERLERGPLSEADLRAGAAPGTLDALFALGAAAESDARHIYAAAALPFRSAAGVARERGRALLAFDLDAIAAGLAAARGDVIAATNTWLARLAPPGR